MTKIGVIEIFNNSLLQIAFYPDIINSEFNPYIFVAVPEEYASIEQKISFYDIIRGCNLDLLHFGRCDGRGYISEDDMVKKYVLEDDLMKSRRGR